MISCLVIPEAQEFGAVWGQSPNSLVHPSSKASHNRKARSKSRISGGWSAPMRRRMRSRRRATNLSTINCDSRLSPLLAHGLTGSRNKGASMISDVTGY